MKYDLSRDPHLDMFRRAWEAVVLPKHPNLTKKDKIWSVEQATKLWREEFGCIMTYGKSGFTEAVFEDPQRELEFLLRWR